MFTGPDVRNVRTASGDGVIECGERGKRSVKAGGSVPAVRMNKSVATTQLIVGNPAEIDRDPIAGAN